MALEIVLQPNPANSGVMPLGKLEQLVGVSEITEPEINKIKAADLAPEQQDAIRSLVKRSLGRLMNNYFEEITAKDATVYYAGNFDGVAITYKTPFGTYLDILAVKREKRGRKLGTSLFGRVVEESDSHVFLRSQPSRGKINEWYRVHTDAAIPFKNHNEQILYNSFFMGIQDINGALEWMKAKPSNYEERNHLFARLGDAAKIFYSRLHDFMLPEKKIVMLGLKPY